MADKGSLIHSVLKLEIIFIFLKVKNKEDSTETICGWQGLKYLLSGLFQKVCWLLEQILEHLSKDHIHGKHTSTQCFHTQRVPLGTILLARGPAKPFACWEQLLSWKFHPLSIFLSAIISQAPGSAYLNPLPSLCSCLLQRNIVRISNVYKHS